MRNIALIDPLDIQPTRIAIGELPGDGIVLGFKNASGNMLAVALSPALALELCRELGARVGRTSPRRSRRQLIGPPRSKPEGT